MSARQGLFITLDGIDGVGKSTQIERLDEFLQSRQYETLRVRDPGSTPIGAKLRAMLLEGDMMMHRRTEAMLFMASRCEMVESTIRPAIAAGKAVLSDRFLLANVVYQSVGGDVPPEKLWQMGHWANDGLNPDLTILLDMPAEAAMARIDRPADRMESRGVEYLSAVRQAFLKELASSGGETMVLDASRSIDDVTASMIEAVNRFFASRSRDCG